MVKLLFLPDALGGDSGSCIAPFTSAPVPACLVRLRPGLLVERSLRTQSTAALGSPTCSSSPRSSTASRSAKRVRCRQPGRTAWPPWARGGRTDRCGNCRTCSSVCSDDRRGARVLDVAVGELRFIPRWRSLSPVSPSRCRSHQTCRITSKSSGRRLRPDRHGVGVGLHPAGGADAEVGHLEAPGPELDTRGQHHHHLDGAA